MVAKAVQEDLESLGLTLSLAKSEAKKDVGRQRVRSCDGSKLVMVTCRGFKNASGKGRGKGED